VEAIIHQLYRELYGKMVASLVSYFKMVDLFLAEDIVQETFMTALKSWDKNGLPDNPPAWLFKVCKNKAINFLAKRNELSSDKSEFFDEASEDRQLEQLFLDHEIKDNQLRLLFAFCHPRLSPKSQVILILKDLCGLRAAEIARGLGMNEEAVVKTISRSRETLREENITLHIPFLLQSHERLDTVHMAIYLLFNEGYSASTGDILIRKDLCIEAMRLAHALLEMELVRTSDTFALMALMSFHIARFGSRLDDDGFLIELEDQERLTWDQEMIRLGNNYLRNTNRKVPTRFLLEAAIASMHSTVQHFEDTDWRTISDLYDQLKKLQPSPFVDLNQAVAIFYCDGSAKALEALNASKHLNWLKNYYLYHALLGKIFLYDGNFGLALEHYEKALTLTHLAPNRRFLNEKINKLKVLIGLQRSGS
jgi:RNA polymerase sigma factor (sigma-70 family)